MINPFKEVNWHPGLAQKREFAISLVIGFPCLAILLCLARRVVSGAWAVGPALWLGGFGLGVGLLLLAMPAMTKPFYVTWYFLACCIGFVISNILATTFYFLILTPIGLLLKSIGRAPLRKGPDNTVASYWEEAEQVTDARRYFSQF
jgi:hypothetical protein